MDLQEGKELLKKLQQERHAYDHAASCLYFDGATVAPRASAEARGVTLGLLTEKSYQLFVNDRTRALLDELWARRDELDLSTRRQTELLSEELDKLTRIPMEEYAAYSRLTAQAAEAWRTAKEKDDYPLFRPYLTQIIEYQRRFAAYQDPSKPAYDALLDGYEKGATTQGLDVFFRMLREKLVPLIASVRDQPSAPAFLGASCPVDRQRALAFYLMELMRIDRSRCALAETEHPFTTGASRYDVRITTHYHENAFLSSMYSVIHEGGHALYELGIADEYQYTCLTNVSMGMHESQSRFYENMIGHSAAFLRFLLPKLRAFFPGALDGVDERSFYLAVNRVEPSLIRTEADEVTYPLHIMVRYELEKQLIDGALSTEELPDAWRALYQEYLGIDVPNDSVGVLQDMHWSDGMFGYFPTYALGSAYAAQFMAAIRRKLDVDALLEKGELGPVNQWLDDNIHHTGALYPPAEQIERACGAPFDPSFYAEHLCRKVRDVYGA